MIHKFLGLLALFLAICIPLDEAEARRRGIPIPIPGLRGETLVLVKELPRIPALLRKDGTYIDLGYKFYSTSGGEWVGHIGSDSEYVRSPCLNRSCRCSCALRACANCRPSPIAPGASAACSGWSSWDSQS